MKSSPQKLISFLCFFPFALTSVMGRSAFSQNLHIPEPHDSAPQYFLENQMLSVYKEFGIDWPTIDFGIWAPDFGKPSYPFSSSRISIATTWELGHLRPWEMEKPQPVESDKMREDENQQPAWVIFYLNYHNDLAAETTLQALRESMTHAALVSSAMIFDWESRPANEAVVAGIDSRQHGASEWNTGVAKWTPETLPARNLKRTLPPELLP